jgi:hypothetical protein
LIGNRPDAKCETVSSGVSFGGITPRNGTPTRELDTGSEKFVGTGRVGLNKSLFAVGNEIPDESSLGGSEAPTERIVTAIQRKVSGRKDRTPADLLKEQLKDGVPINHEEYQASFSHSLDDGKFLFR